MQLHNIVTQLVLRQATHMAFVANKSHDRQLNCDMSFLITVARCIYALNILRISRRRRRRRLFIICICV